MYLLKGNHVRNTKQNVQHINPFSSKKKNHAVCYGTTAQLVAKQNWSRAVNLCWNSLQMLEQSITVGAQLHVYLSDYFYMSDLWVASYKVQLLYSSKFLSSSCSIYYSSKRHQTRFFFRNSLFTIMKEWTMEVRSSDGKCERSLHFFSQNKK
jgi:hypothetical protein